MDTAELREAFVTTHGPVQILKGSSIFTLFTNGCKGEPTRDAELARKQDL